MAIGAQGNTQAHAKTTPDYVIATKTIKSGKVTLPKGSRVRHQTKAKYFKSHNSNQKPVSSTKETATKHKGNMYYIYAKKNMLKLPDRRIRKQGNYQYRLAVRYNGLNSNGMSYSVGHVKNYFYVPTLNA